jgi:hypothetical protein
MTSAQATTQVCSHPGRDIAIVALSAALVGLLAFTVVTLFKGGPLDALKLGGTAFGATVIAGFTALQYLKRSH